MTSGLGETMVLEVDLLEPVVYGSEVKRYRLVRSTKRLLYPYRKNVPIPETELQSRYPNIWSYVVRNRDLLASRASLRKSGGKFYELVWPRDETWLRSPKLLIRDLAPRTAFAPDLDGTFLVGGTAVILENREFLMALLAYLNSAVIDGLIRRTTPQFRGNFQKFEPQHLLGVPVLDRLVEDQNFSGQLAALAARIVGRGGVDEGDVAAQREDEKAIDTLIAQAANDRGLHLDA